MSNTPRLLSPDIMIPDLLQQAPQVRPVFDRYGLQGCGGQWGPMESLGFFAKAHEVPLDQLLSELQQALEDSARAEPSRTTSPLPVLNNPKPRPEDGIYRPFFTAGITVLLTVGAVWGAYLLLKIGLSGSFTSVGIHEVNAHGHAQIFGWVGLFVMGFAYQAFPRFKHTSLAYPKLAFATLWMMLTGIALRSVLEPAGLAYPVLWNAAMASGVLEISAIGLFGFVLLATWGRSGKSLASYDWYIISALFWFFVQGIYAAQLFAGTVYAPNREALLQVISTWQAPLREIQIHGFAMLMILGVSQRLFHHFYGFPQPNKKFSLAMLPLFNLALVGIVTGLILMRTHSHAWSALWYGSVLLMAAAAVSLVLNWRLYKKPAERDRNLKFMRAAYVWLFVSLGMLVMLPVYQFALLPALAPNSEAAALGFSHAYYGAIRHAVTVGFISLMIVGVAAKVIPTLNGVDIRALSSLWGPFWLINFGCALRVVGQTLTDFSPNVFPLAGVSGLFEVTGLALWGFHMLAIMTKRVQVKLSNAAPLQASERIQPQHKVGEVLQAHPQLLDNFLKAGFTPLANPVMRQTVAHAISIESACRRMEVEPHAFLQQLNAQIRQEKQNDCGCCSVQQVSPN